MTAQHAPAPAPAPSDVVVELAPTQAIDMSALLRD